MSEAIFSPKDRQIIKFHNGKDVVSADPLVIEGRLRISAASRGTSMDRVINGANAASKPDATEEEKAEAYQQTEMLCIIAAEVFALKLASETAEAFGIQTEPGCADMAHCIGVIDAFYRDLEKKNQSGAPNQDTSPSTAATLRDAIPATTPTMSAAS